LTLNHSYDQRTAIHQRRWPILAAKIIAGRPYKDVDDLLRISGVGPKLLRPDSSLFDRESRAVNW